MSVLPEHCKEEADAPLTYLRNMSCVGKPHPDFKHRRLKFLDMFGFDIAMQAKSIYVWAYRELVEHFIFKGVELLMIDAEGYDIMILNSVDGYCHAQERFGFWE